MQQLKNNWRIAVLIILYTVGVIGIAAFKSDYITSLTPINLIIAASLIWPKSFNSKLILTSLFIFCGGYLVELLGISTGFPFGAYQYGNNLGPKIFGVPLIIGVNWWIMVYTSSEISRKLTKNIYVKVLITGLLMVSLDLLIEQVAPLLDFWNWNNSHIPINNYIAWFFIGCIFSFIWEKHTNTSNNKTAFQLYFIQLLFFGILVISRVI
ncbi:MAG: carotenoid biosynthesis protein [Salibacteraceae bacterium]